VNVKVNTLYNIGFVEKGSAREGSEERGSVKITPQGGSWVSVERIK